MNDFTKIGTTEEEINKLFSKTQIGLLYYKNAIFLSSILGRTEFRWNWEIPTAQTNGLWIEWNPAWFIKLPKDTRVTVLAHELWHIAYEHMSRIGTRDPKKWNIACDHVINNQLASSGYKFDDTTAYMDRRYQNMSTEEVYKKLPDPPPNDPVKDMGDDLVPLPQEKEIEVMAKVVSAVQSARMGNQAGDIPGEITLAVDKFLNPILPWNVLLERFFIEQSKDDYSWKRPNRRYEEYLPSMHADNGLTTINYYLDVSGSISDADILRFNSEVAHIKREFEPETLNLITFDTRLRDIYTFNRDDPFEQIVVTGRGGTNLFHVGQHIKKTKPSVAVIFSDMHVDPMQFVGDIPVLWIVIGNPNATVPFGRMIHIDSE